MDPLVKFSSDLVIYKLLPLIRFLMGSKIGSIFSINGENLHIIKLYEIFT